MAAERSDWQELLPGLALLAGFGVIARLVGVLLSGVSPLIIAIALGAIIANTIGTPSSAKRGLDRHNLLLETGIVLLGAGLAIDELATTGATVVVLAAFVVIGGVLLLEWLSGIIFGMDREARALLASGASVCGVSAVLAVAGATDADEVDITYAVGTILLFDAVTLVVFPLIGGFLGLEDKVFGVWAGLTLFSTGPTAAVGFAFSETAGEWATLTKLVRNSFIGILALGYALRTAAGGQNRLSGVEVWSQFPKFLVGFLVVVAFANLGLLSASAFTSIGTIGDWLFTLAFVGLGFELEWPRLRQAGLRPIVIVGSHLLLMSGLTLVAVRTLI